MTPELSYLAYAALLTSLLWLPYILGVIMTIGLIPALHFRSALPSDTPQWVYRANRAHQNAVENLIPFAVMVIVAHLTGVSTEMTAIWAVVFLFARLAHAVIFWIGIPYLRTITFAVGLLAVLGIFYEIVTAVPTA
ncbi:MAG: MAPEG family protein [Pseudomonadota bacterium]